MERKSLLCRYFYLPPLCFGHGRLSSGRMYHHINKDLQGCYIVSVKFSSHVGTIMTHSFNILFYINCTKTVIYLVMKLDLLIIIIIIIINIKDWTLWSVPSPELLAARANASSVFQLFSFLVVCSGMISKGFGFVAFFASVQTNSVCIHLSCLVCL